MWIFSQGSKASLERSLRRYRIFAMIVGCGLATLVFIGMPLQFIFGVRQVDAIAGPIHGFFYIAYLFFALDLARRGRFSLPDLLMMIGAGLVPIMAFVVERRVTRAVRSGVRPWKSRPIEGSVAPVSAGGFAGPADAGFPVTGEQA